MKPQPWRQRLLESTRGQILALLRNENRTVNELAAVLNLTDSAARAHLVSISGRGLYEITSDHNRQMLALPRIIGKTDPQTSFASLRSRQNRKFGMYHYTSVMPVRSDNILERLLRCLAQKSSGKLGRLNTDTPLILSQTRRRSDALAVITTLLALSVTQRLTLARSRRSFAFTMKLAT
jgi:regulatory ArsR family protein